jgi:AcrR family transcriptional regulator
MARPRTDIRLRLLHAARTRFLTDGVDGASLRAIAAGARTSIGMVYYYFPTKDELFLAVVEEVYVGLLADLESLLAPALPVLDRLRGLYARVGALHPDEIQVVRLMLREALVSTTRLERLVARFKRGHLPLLVRLVVDGQKEGVFDRGIASVLVLVAMLALGGPGQAMLRLGRGRLPLPAPRAPAGGADALVDVLLRGVGPRQGGKRR